MDLQVGVINPIDKRNKKKHAMTKTAFSLFKHSKMTNAGKFLYIIELQLLNQKWIISKAVFNNS